MRLFRRSLLLLLAGLVFFVFAGLVATWAPDQPREALKARWAAPPSQFMLVDGMQVHWRDEGPRDDPQPLVLLHGTSDSLHTWDGWAAALRKQRRIIRFDLPGFGLTGPDPNNDYSIARYVRFVGEVLDHLGVMHCVLAGNSLGGEIAWNAAVAMPQRVQRLVLVDAAGYPLHSESVPLAFSLARSALAQRLFAYILPRGLVQASLRNLYGDPSKVTPELVDRYYHMALRSGNREALGHRIAAMRFDGFERVRQVTQPTLLLWGGRDRLIPVAAGRRFERDLPKARLVVFEGLGHLPHQEDPARTVLEVRRFLGLGQDDKDKNG